ncbi:unnamed protein product [Closterium sp. Yama58-4]|nr:unnamed protein product [Closterium sp. Yama58-4]
MTIYNTFTIYGIFAVISGLSSRTAVTAWSDIEHHPASVEHHAAGMGHHRHYHYHATSPHGNSFTQALSQHSHTQYIPNDGYSHDDRDMLRRVESVRQQQERDSQPPPLFTAVAAAAVSCESFVLDFPLRRAAAAASAATNTASTAASIFQTQRRRRRHRTVIIGPVSLQRAAVAAGYQLSQKRRKGPCSMWLKRVFLVRVKSPADFAARASLPSTATVILHLQRDLTLPRGVVFGRQHSCTILMSAKWPGYTLTGGNPMYPVLRVWNTSNVMSLNVNYQLAVTESSPECSTVPELGKAVTCPAISIHRSFGVQIGKVSPSLVPAFQEKRALQNAPPRTLNHRVRSSRCTQHLAVWSDANVRRDGGAVCADVPKRVSDAIRNSKDAKMTARKDKERALEEALTSVGGQGGAGPKPKKGRMEDWYGEGGMSAKRAADDAICLFIAGTRTTERVCEHPLFLNMLRAVNAAGGGYVPPKARYIGGAGLLACKQQIEKGLSPITKSWKETGVTIASDMMKDKSGRAQMKVVFINASGAVFLEAFDCKAETKTGAFIVSVLQPLIEKLGPEHVVAICTDGGSNYVFAGKLLQKKYPHMEFVPCATHVLDLLLEDFGGMDWAQEVVSVTTDMITFLRSHTWTRAFLRCPELHGEKKSLQPLRPAGTRFGTQYFAVSRLREIRQHLVTMVTHTDWAEKGRKQQTGATFEKAVMDVEWWGKVDTFVKVMELPHKLMRKTDGPAKGMMGALYDMMLQLTVDLKELLARADCKLEESEKEALMEHLRRRWDESLACPLHVGGFGSEEAEAGRAQLKEGKGDMAAWWKVNGWEYPELAGLARRAVSQAVSASPCERGWSTWDGVHTARRNRLGSEKVRDLVYVAHNWPVVHGHHQGAAGGAGPSGEGSIFGRVDVLRSMSVRLDSLSVTGVASFIKSPGVIRVALSGYGPALLKSNVVISNNDVYGVNTPILLHRGAVGVTVRNNYVHNYTFAGIKCGADVHYSGACMLSRINSNLVVSSGRNLNGDHDSAGIYFYTHWFSPGNAALCNYVFNGDHCFYLDHCTSGVLVRGGACVNTYDGMKVNNGKRNVIENVAMKGTRGSLGWTSCFTVTINNCLKDPGNYWEAMRVKYYNSARINQLWPWMKDVCKETSANGGVPCNPPGQPGADVTGACSGLGTDNLIDVVAVNTTSYGLDWKHSLDGDGDENGDEDGDGNGDGDGDSKEDGDGDSNGGGDNNGYGDGDGDGMEMG